MLSRQYTNGGLRCMLSMNFDADFIVSVSLVSNKGIIFWHGVIDHAHAQSNVVQKMILIVRAGMAYLLKPRLGLISMPVYGLNF